MTGKKPVEAVVLVDANNYIKGYRYEMHCVAKAVRHQQAIVYCTTPMEQCQEINEKVSFIHYPSFHVVVSYADSHPG